jgi:phage tail sheath protein FI
MFDYLIFKALFIFKLPINHYKMKYNFIIIILLLFIQSAAFGQITPQYQHPGVYIEEIVEPALILSTNTNTTVFIGYTENNHDYLKPNRIHSLFEFEKIYGKAPKPQFTIDTIINSDITLNLNATTQYHLYHSVALFFLNGGSDCVIISTGAYNAEKGVAAAELEKGIKALEIVNEINIMTIPDVVQVSAIESSLLYNQTLKYCEANKLFAILDIQYGDKPLSDGYVTDFKSSIISNNSANSYGAAYYPWVVTTLYEVAKIKAEDYITNWNEFKINTDSDIYKKAQELIFKTISVTPPSGMMAGIYARTDNNEGVWNAAAGSEANLMGIAELTQQLNEAQNQELNAPVDGKSINCLRYFNGIGNVVWGSRTLNSNDNEYKYVPIRRLTNMLENSIKAGLNNYIFEPNVERTWGSIEQELSAYLDNIYRSGALAGSKPSDSYQVSVGLNKTMTQLDIDNRMMKINVLIAPVQSAEFIILKFEMKEISD